MLSFPNCKINIGLNIISKRDDGYHNIETVFYPVNRCDVLEINKRALLNEDKFSYTCGLALKLSGNEIEGEIESNLCYKAFQLLREDFQLPDMVMHLHKMIPSGAGLGGGSSDAAFVLKLLNNIFNLSLSDEQLKSYASKLGSDCSFFIDNLPSFATGRGEQLEQIGLNLTGLNITMVKPAIAISTADAYQLVKPIKPFVSLQKLILQPLEMWKQNIVNDFENGIFTLYPGLKQIKNELYASGCIYASMSGSGSCIYGMSYTKLIIENKFNNCHVWQGVL